MRDAVAERIAPVQVDGLCVRADFMRREAAIAARALLLDAGLIMLEGAAIFQNGRGWYVTGPRAADAGRAP